MCIRDRAIKEFQKGDLQLLVMHPASGGHGLNLHQNCHTLIWYSPTFDLEHHQQVEARMGKVRQAQAKTGKIPRYIHLAIEGTIEERILAAVGDKDLTQQKLLSSCKPTRE